ncbi:MAG: methyltransferase domain-containing protein [Alphaproteobacteria bacterium]|nr:methyltransferase domain-containing protein [Alphaproteobacteria bacterium]
MNADVSGAPKSWDPAHYLKYAGQRIRPALDLLARIPLDEARTIADLGCGPGNVVEHLARAFPGAAITGVDNSAQMLNAARSEHGDAATWVQMDAARWEPDAPQDLIFANASLQWLDRHEILFPRLMGFLRPGGVLAVQMPDQFAEPSHVEMRAVATEGPWAATLKSLLRPAPVARPEDYYDWLSPRAASLDIWRTAYTQVMEGNDPVLDWIGASAMKPLREALPADQKGPFRDALAERLRRAYPRRADGTTLFAFKRLFIIAVSL